MTARRASAAGAVPQAAAPGPQYTVDVSDRRAHTLRVTARLPKPDACQVVSLPVWIPGSYMVREFGRHLSGLKARQGQRTCALEQVDKTTWQVHCEGTAELVLEYAVYAFEPSVRTAFLSEERGFFNGTSVCLRFHGREGQAHRLGLKGLPKAWSVATAMASAGMPGQFCASGYDELVDHPFELGPFWRGQFTACGAVHEFVVAGAWPSFDGERLLRDSRRICEEQIRFWHGPRGKPPFERYVFMLHAVDDGYGGLEHRASTALIAARKDLPRQGESAQSEGYRTLLGLISHEYFHTWNVKRLKPLSLCAIDYARENYTELLWFFEGFTSYYDDLMLWRAGLIDAAQYLQLLSKTATAVAGMPGRQVQSVAQASFDAWNKYYRPDENTPNATVSYYTKGALVALCLDLTLRASGSSLDAVMRRLWNSASPAARRLRDRGDVGITEADIRAAVAAEAGRSLDAELDAWVHGRGELPCAQALAAVGVACSRSTVGLAAQWGLRVQEGSSCVVRGVLRGGSAEAAGLCAGDELIAVDGWRVRKLDDLSAVLGSAAAPSAHQLWVARGGRVHQFSLQPQSGGVDAPTIEWRWVDGTDAAVQGQRDAWRQGR